MPRRSKRIKNKNKNSSKNTSTTNSSNNNLLTNQTGGPPPSRGNVTSPPDDNNNGNGVTPLTSSSTPLERAVTSYKLDRNYIYFLRDLKLRNIKITKTNIARELLIQLLADLISLSDEVCDVLFSNYQGNSLTTLLNSVISMVTDSDDCVTSIINVIEESLIKKYDPTSWNIFITASKNLMKDMFDLGKLLIDNNTFLVKKNRKNTLDKNKKPPGFLDLSGTNGDSAPTHPSGPFRRVEDGAPFSKRTKGATKDDLAAQRNDDAAVQRLKKHIQNEKNKSKNNNNNNNSYFDDKESIDDSEDFSYLIPKDFNDKNDLDDILDYVDDKIRGIKGLSRDEKRSFCKIFENCKNMDDWKYNLGILKRSITQDGSQSYHDLPRSKRIPKKSKNDDNHIKKYIEKLSISKLIENDSSNVLLAVNKNIRKRIDNNLDKIQAKSDKFSDGQFQKWIENKFGIDHKLFYSTLLCKYDFPKDVEDMYKDVKKISNLLHEQNGNYINMGSTRITYEEFKRGGINLDNEKVSYFTNH